MNSFMDFLLSLDREEEASQPTLAETLSRDIENLLNHSVERQRQSNDPLIAGSVVSYGLPLPVGTRIDTARIRDLMHQIAIALERFEPRIDARMIEVRPCGLEKRELGVFAIEIKAGLKNSNYNTLDLRLKYDLHFGLSTIEARMLDEPRALGLH